MRHCPRGLRRGALPCLCLVVGSVLAAGPTSARSEDTFEVQAAVYAGGGLCLPVSPSDFTDGWDRGWCAGAGIGYRLAPRSEVRTLMFYDRFDLNTESLPGVSGGAYSVLEVSVDYKLYLTGLRSSDRLAAYLVGGLGFGGQTISATTFPPPLGTTQEVNQTKLAYDVGGGVDVRVLPKTALFAEAKWVLVRTQDENTTYVPLRAGVRFLLAE